VGQSPKNQPHGHLDTRFQRNPGRREKPCSQQVSNPLWQVIGRRISPLYRIASRETVVPGSLRIPDDAGCIRAEEVPFGRRLGDGKPLIIKSHAIPRVAGANRELVAILNAVS